MRPDLASEEIILIQKIKSLGQSENQEFKQQIEAALAALNKSLSDTKLTQKLKTRFVNLKKFLQKLREPCAYLMPRDVRQQSITAKNSCFKTLQESVISQIQQYKAAEKNSTLKIILGWLETFYADSIQDLIKKPENIKYKYPVLIIGINGTDITYIDETCYQKLVGINSRNFVSTLTPLSNSHYVVDIDGVYYKLDKKDQYSDAPLKPSIEEVVTAFYRIMGRLINDKIQFSSTFIKVESTSTSSSRSFFIQASLKVGDDNLNSWLETHNSRLSVINVSNFATLVFSNLCMSVMDGKPHNYQVIAQAEDTVRIEAIDKDQVWDGDIKIREPEHLPASASSSYKDIIAFFPHMDQIIDRQGPFYEALISMKPLEIMSEWHSAIDVINQKYQQALDRCVISGDSSDRFGLKIKVPEEFNRFLSHALNTLHSTILAAFHAQRSITYSDLFKAVEPTLGHAFAVLRNKANSDASQAYILWTESPGSGDILKALGIHAPSNRSLREKIENYLSQLSQSLINTHSIAGAQALLERVTGRAIKNNGKEVLNLENHPVNDTQLRDTLLLGANNGIRKIILIGCHNITGNSIQQFLTRYEFEITQCNGLTFDIILQKIAPIIKSAQKINIIHSSGSLKYDPRDDTLYIRHGAHEHTIQFKQNTWLRELIESGLPDCVINTCIGYAKKQNIILQEGITLLHICIRKNRVESIAVLLKRIAQINDYDFSFYDDALDQVLTALRIAQDSSREDVVTLLRSHVPRNRQYWMEWLEKLDALFEKSTASHHTAQVIFSGLHIGTRILNSTGADLINAMKKNQDKPGRQVADMLLRQALFIGINDEYPLCEFITCKEGAQQYTMLLSNDTPFNNSPDHIAVRFLQLLLFDVDALKEVVDSERNFSAKMKDHIEHAVANTIFLERGANAIVKLWLERCQQYESYFSTQHPASVILIPKSFLHNLYRKINIITRLLEEYKPDPENGVSCFTLTYEKIITECQEEVLSEDTLLSPQEALQFLKETTFILEQLCMQKNKREFLLLSSKEREDVINNIQFQSMDPQMQQWILEVIKESRTPLTRLSIVNCSALTNNLLEAILRYCPDLVELKLVGCSKITGNFDSILQEVKNIQTVHLEGVNLETLSSDVLLQKLSSLFIRNCVKLSEITLTIKTSKVHIEQCTNLSKFIITADGNNTATLKDCIKLKNTELFSKTLWFSTQKLPNFNNPKAIQEYIHGFIVQAYQVLYEKNYALAKHIVERGQSIIAVFAQGDTQYQEQENKLNCLHALALSGLDAFEESYDIFFKLINELALNTSVSAIGNNDLTEIDVQQWLCELVKIFLKLQGFSDVKFALAGIAKIVSHPFNVPAVNAKKCISTMALLLHGQLQRLFRSIEYTQKILGSVDTNTRAKAFAVLPPLKEIGLASPLLIDSIVAAINELNRNHNTNVSAALEQPIMHIMQSWGADLAIPGKVKGSLVNHRNTEINKIIHQWGDGDNTANIGVHWKDLVPLNQAVAPVAKAGKFDACAKAAEKCSELTSRNAKSPSMPVAPLNPSYAMLENTYGSMDHVMQSLDEALHAQRVVDTLAYIKIIFQLFQTSFAEGHIFLSVMRALNISSMTSTSNPQHSSANTPISSSNPVEYQLVTSAVAQPNACNGKKSFLYDSKDDSRACLVGSGSSSFLFTVSSPLGADRERIHAMVLQLFSGQYDIDVQNDLICFILQQHQELLPKDDDSLADIIKSYQKEFEGQSIAASAAVC